MSEKTGILEKVSKLRYIVFLIDSKHKEHDGRVYCSFDDARDAAVRCIDERYCDKAVIGMFVMDQQAEDMTITKVETFGFPGDKKRMDQLDLFKK